MKYKGTYHIQLPSDKPIEEKILDFCNSMYKQMDSTANAHSNKSIREGARNMATAYKTVANHVLDEITIKNKLMEIKEDNPLTSTP